MSRLNRRSSVICLLVAFALVSLAGCVVKPDPAIPPDSSQIVVTPDLLEPPRVHEYVSPIRMSYFVVNPLEVKYPEQAGPIPPVDNTFVIGGLRDKAVEQRINRRLTSLYQELKERDVPPYRGIRVLVPGGAKPIENTVHSHVTFNYNNVLSLVVTNSRSYVVSGQSYPQHSSVTEALTIDLRTGDEISLRDVFTDDVDYLAILSDHISRLAMRSSETDDFWGIGPNLRLVTAYKGMGPNQKFNLSQGGLSFVFDYGTPEFDIRFWPSHVSLGFQELGDVFALTERFKSRESIFEDTSPPVKEFVQSQMPFASSGFPDEKLHGRVRVLEYYHYPKELPHSLLDFLNDLSDHSEIVADLNRQPAGSSGCTLYQNLSVQRSGSYYTVSLSRDVYKDNRSAVTVKNFCMDENLNHLELSDLFVPGFEYMPTIRRALEAVVIQNGWRDVTPPLIELLTNLEFGLGFAEVSFHTRPVTVDQSSWPISFSVPYKDFGCHNMTIFR